jgi:hypothetical protein|tara:strand:- start:72 stop:461 length:390 start_codon:yes stop_codon:yes gene_type:complete
MPKDKPYPWESKKEAEIRISNATERSEKYQLGGVVRPPSSPSMPQYKKGGKVDVTDVVKKVEQKVAQEKRFDKRIAEADKKGETIQSGPDTLPMSDLHKYYKKGHSAIKKDQIKKMKKKILKKKRGKKK